jgi:hypothetical protein
MNKKEYLPEDWAISENSRTPGFLVRHKIFDRNWNFSWRASNFGRRCPQHNWDWAEIKSSVLVKTLVHNNGSHQNLLDFLQSIVINIFSFLVGTYIINVQRPTNYSTTYHTLSLLKSTPMKVQYLIIHQLNEYLEKRRGEGQKKKTRSYPVGQSQLRNTPEDIWWNFFALWNFIKWIWFKLMLGEFTRLQMCHRSQVRNGRAYAYMTLINIFQQRLLYFHDLIRGNRVNLKSNEFTKNTQMGISSIYVDKLQRTPRGNKTGAPLGVVEAWHHPGDVQCRVPYRGGYGLNIRKFRSEDSYYGSLQCGISGSTQYVLFMYLLSICVQGSKQPMIDVRNVITSCVLILVGDGGHNIREIMCGLTASIILLKNIIDELKNSLNAYQGDLHAKIRRFVADVERRGINTTAGGVITELYNLVERTLSPTLPCGTSRYIVFKHILIFMANWSSFIDEFYRFTGDANIVGLFAGDWIPKRTIDEIIPTDLGVYTKRSGSGVSYVEIPNQTNANSVLAQSAKLATFKYFFSDKNKLRRAVAYDVYNGYYLTNVFFAMENNRHLPHTKPSSGSPSSVIMPRKYTTEQLQDWKIRSFKHAPNLMMQAVINIFPTHAEINKTVKAAMNAIIRDMRVYGCDTSSAKAKIPFAFSMKTSRKRRSVKRKVSRKRRSVKRKVSRKRRSVKRKVSRKRRSSKRKVSRKRRSSKRKVSRKRRSVKRKVSRKRRSVKRKTSRKRR